MHLTDVLAFFNRLGVRLVNDVTALVTAEVTAAMDPEGMGAHIGSKAPSADIEMTTKAKLAVQKSNFVTKVHFDTNISTISTLISDSMKGVVEIVKTTNVNIAAVKTLVATMREETDKKIKAIKKKMQAKNEENDAKDAERDAKDVERDAKDVERDMKDAQRDKLIASLQRASCKEKKRSADNQGEGGTQKKATWNKVATNISKKNGSSIFRWAKTINSIAHGESNFQTMEEAEKAMAVYCENID